MLRKLATITPLPRDAASQAAMDGQNWHLNMLKLVGSWVAKGNTDEKFAFLPRTILCPVIQSSKHGWTFSQ